MEDNTLRQALEDISFIKNVVNKSQVQFGILSHFLIIVALFKGSVDLLNLISLFVINSTEQQQTINLVLRILNIVIFCVLTFIFLRKRNGLKKSSIRMTIQFMDLWGIVLLFIPLALYIINVIIGLIAISFNVSTAFNEGFISVYVQLTISIVSLCFALIATGTILGNRLINGYGIAILIIYVFTFVFPRSIEVKSILDWIPGSTSTISLIPQSIYAAIIIPFTYLFMGFYLKNKVGDTHGDT